MCNKYIPVQRVLSNVTSSRFILYKLIPARGCIFNTNCYVIRMDWTINPTCRCPHHLSCCHWVNFLVFELFLSNDIDIPQSILRCNVLCLTRDKLRNEKWCTLCFLAVQTSAMQPALSFSCRLRHLETGYFYRNPVHYKTYIHTNNYNMYLVSAFIRTFYNSGSLPKCWTPRVSRSYLILFFWQNPILS